LRGAIGSTVSLTVLDGKGGSRTVSLVRRAFAPQPPKLEIVEHGRIGIVATSGSPAAVLPAVAKSIVAANPAPSWIILDLRHDSGGILQDYIATADVFLSQGRIVTVHGHPDEFYDAHAVNDPAMALPENVPLVVLVDHVTAAGAELVAAALQDHRRATIIGQKTFGRGSVQTLLMLGQGWAMKMTTGYLARPDGPSLEYGVKPDCTSDLQDQALIDWVVQRMARGEIPCRATSETPLPPSG
jgi:carboxyl-terminal processing protease